MKIMNKTLRNLSKAALFFVGMTSANAPTLLAKVGELCVKGGQVLTNAPMNLAKGFQTICNECPAISTNVTNLECAKIAAESAKECATIAANATIKAAELGLQAAQATANATIQAAKITADGAVAVAQVTADATVVVAQTLAPYIPVICATIVVVVVVVAVAYVVTQEIKHRQAVPARVPACAG